MVAKTVSFVNYKGGVGKTATAVNIAAYIASDHDKKVLLVDLDPQTSATFHLMPQDSEHRGYLGHGTAWKDWKDSHGTLSNIFQAYADQKTPPDINDIIVPRVVTRGPRRLAQNLHVLPGDIDLIDIDYKLEKLPIRGLDILSRELEKVKGQYDYILCDCPPNLYTMTKNGLFASDYYVIPVLPDYLSTLGIYELLKRIKGMESVLGKRIECKGIVFTRVQKIVVIHNLRMREVERDSELQKLGISCFENYVRNLVGLQYAADQCLPICVFPHYSPYLKPARDYQDLTTEFVARA